MKPSDTEPKGAHASPNGDAVSDELWAARLLHQAIRPQPLSAAELQAIGARLPRPSATATTRAPHWVWRVATAAFLLLCGGALMAATAHFLRRAPVTKPAAAPSLAAPRPAHVRAAVPTREPAAPPPSVVANTAAPPSVARVASPRPGPTVGVEPPPPEPTAALLPSALREEAELVASALGRLREGKDAAGALALLDEHDRRFGAAGVLGDEVSATRIEAWLQTGQHGRALAVLDRRALRPTGAARALLAARADLRAEAGRCAEARADYDRLLARDASDAIEERALFGRASCLSRIGDAAAARVDLRHYLSRFPTGSFAARARAALER